MLAQGAVARGRAHAFVRRARPLLALLLAPKPVRSLALSYVMAHPERVPYREALRIVRSYARASAYDATNTAMRQSYFADAERLTVPVTLAFGEHDRLIRPVRLDTPGSRSLVLRDCGHIPMWDQPLRVSELILEGLRAQVGAWS